MSIEALNAYYDEVSRCSRCGFCQPTCPTYVVDPQEGAVARGRNTLVRAVIEGQACLDRETIGIIDDCLRCGACVTACFAGVRTDRIMAAARAHYVETQGRARWLGWVMGRLLPRRRLLSRAVGILAWLKRSGLSRLAGLGRHLGSLGRGLARAEALVDSMPARPFSDLVKPGSRLAPYGEKKALVGYFIGCRTEFLYPGIGRSAVEVLRHCGAEVLLLEEPASCCGLPPYSYGFAAPARDLARQNTLAFDALPCDFVVTEIGSCHHFLREYGPLYGQDPEFGPAALRLSAKVLYLSEFAERFGPRQWGPYKAALTYQDSCQLGHLQKQFSGPRSLLKALPGVDFREMTDAAACCGGAGAYTVTHAGASDAILAPKLANLEATGAKEVVVACQSCYLQLKQGLRRKGSAVAVRHLAEVLLDSLGGSVHGLREPQG